MNGRPPRRTRIIAELGENHLGDMERARQMVIAAAEAGADIVKCQSFLASEVNPSDPEREWFAQVQLSDEMHRELQQLAQRHRVSFLSAPFSLNRARFLCEELGLRSIKVASSEMLNFPLLDYLDSRAQTVYLSTGMATLEEIAAAVKRLPNVTELFILHCVTAYPAEDGEANLQAIPVLKRRFPEWGIGYSDHTRGILAPAAAAALGACVIEKHFTLDKTLPGTDHVCSAEPEEFKQMVAMIRRIEQLLGEPVKGPVQRELQVREFVRKRFPK